ncbi:MAG: DUF4912 domain-containing protein [Roseofilum sp. Belize Diploria]|nr:DUF4912 domain-containing protein [Roseofilum sp. Belize Diploria]MBP0010850.1 DUF4912 domain-containing protein [Roseofilum sp. Belize Diploria]
MTNNRPPLSEMTLRQLRKVASEYQISRYSRMRKSELLQAIMEAQNSSTPAKHIQTEPMDAQEAVEAAKFEVGNSFDPEVLASVDDELTDLPSGYGQPCIVLMPRDPQWAYAYWDISNDKKELLRTQGGQQLALRIYDVTDININYESPHSMQEYPCDELAREWYIPIPISDRIYVVDIGYRCADGRWLILARSAPVTIPPIYPSDWVEDRFMTVSWDKTLGSGDQLLTLDPPGRKTTEADVLYQFAREAEAKRLAGSVFGSETAQAISSYVFPSGVGKWAAPAASVQTESGAGMTTSGAGLTTSGAGMTTSGAGLTTSGAGLTTSGAGMTTSGVGLTTSGVGLTTSGAGMTTSGVGLTTSGVGLTTSGVGLTTSGVGLTTSGAGMTTSGAGMTNSGVGLTTSGVGLTTSGVGLTTSGVGLTTSGVGLTTSGVGLTTSGVGLTMSGVGLTTSGVGLTTSGVGQTMSGVGLTTSGVGQTMSGVGLTTSGAGLTMSGVGLTMSGVGQTMSGVGQTMSGVGQTMSGVGLTMSGVGLTMSGTGMEMPTMSGVHMSGVGFSAPPIQPRKFWLVADAELIVYGATEPDATVTIGGKPIKLNPDGTFRFQMSFQDGLIDYPIMAVAADGVQNRSVHMQFTRKTPSRDTNTKEEAVLEWVES